MKCAMCGTRINSVNEGIDQGWILNFKELNNNQNDSVCVDCIEVYLLISEDQEIEIRSMSIDI